ncbi:hypothetical protein [Leptothoe spongobia]|uniref:Uncharacterized protein n=1 Tax=Leptothoe spongobia TAU-MAC 1115 TaxID=1967444 RepID=A0A947DIH5_9CYAN|nr:hypothetical protein [Leptothoe spongobia]MBT9317615.1 hypothetical protein [Leptothoe spongobia TAU-MAC 1115]
MPIDISLLRQSIRQNLDTEELLFLLDRAIELIPQETLPELLKGVLDLDSFQVDEIADELILEEVLDFQADSLAGVYYESFRVNSRNYMDQSRGTINWIAEFKRLMNRCIKECQAGEYFQAHPAFEVLIELLDEVDECRDDIIFFADESGSWQVGVSWENVLPSYFTALAEVVEPEVYAESVVKVVKKHANYRGDIHLKTAMKIAQPAQRKALKAII